MHTDVYKKAGLSESKNRIQKVNRVKKGIQIVNNEEQKNGKEKEKTKRLSVGSGWEGTKELSRCFSTNSKEFDFLLSNCTIAKYFPWHPELLK